MTPIVFYARVDEINDYSIFVSGISYNDANHRGQYVIAKKNDILVSVNEEPIDFSEIDVGDIVSVYYTGTIQETSPLTVPSVKRIVKLIDASEESISTGNNTNNALEDIINKPNKEYCFYAEIKTINGNRFRVDGLEINDINHRGEYTFSIDPSKTDLIWRGVDITVDVLQPGYTIAIYYSGAVSETYPAQISNVDRIWLLDDISLTNSDHPGARTTDKFTNVGSSIDNTQNTIENLSVANTDASESEHYFYAEIKNIFGTCFRVNGFDTNDADFQGHYTFSLRDEDAELICGDTTISIDDLKPGDDILIYYSGDVPKSYFTRINNIDRICLIDDASIDFNNLNVKT